MKYFWENVVRRCDRNVNTSSVYIYPVCIWTGHTECIHRVYRTFLYRWPKCSPMAHVYMTVFPFLPFVRVPQLATICRWNKRKKRPLYHLHIPTSMLLFTWSERIHLFIHLHPFPVCHKSFVAWLGWPLSSLIRKSHFPYFRHYYFNTQPLRVVYCQAGLNLYYVYY